MPRLSNFIRQIPTCLLLIFIRFTYVCVANCYLSVWLHLNRGVLFDVKRGKHLTNGRIKIVLYNNTMSVSYLMQVDLWLKTLVIIALKHLFVVQILQTSNTATPNRMLMLWNVFDINRPNADEIRSYGTLQMAFTRLAKDHRDGTVRQSDQLTFSLKHKCSSRPTIYRFSWNQFVGLYAKCRLNIIRYLN